MDPESLVLIPNLGAEEGDGPPGGRAARAVAHAARLWRHLFAANHRVIGGADLGDAEEHWPAAFGRRSERAALRFLRGGGGATAWLGDPAAAALARAHGAAWHHADPEIVMRVHDKAFALESARALDEEPRCLRGLAHAYAPADLADADALLADLTRRLASWPAWTGGRFTLKPRLGGSGRGRVGGSADRLDRAAVAGALPRLAARGGAILEPWLERSADLSVVLHVRGPGDDDTPAVTLLGALEQRVTPSGVYLGHMGEIDARGRVYSGLRFDDHVRGPAAAVAERARAAGYFGPCGVDGFAFRWPDPDTGELRTTLRPIVELNARFTMGIVVVGLIRRALHEVKRSLALQPGERLGFLFGLACPDAWPGWQEAADGLSDRSLLVPLTPDADATGPALLFTDDRDTLLQSLRTD